MLMDTRLGRLSEIPISRQAYRNLDPQIHPERFTGFHEGRLAKPLGITQFGVNHVTLDPGAWSSLRHWHTTEDEFVYVLAGELVLVENAGETVLRAGDCATFAKRSGDGHHLINRAAETAVYLEVGSRQPDDLTTCSDIDMMSANADGAFTHKDGSPYPRT
jgi:uncharacterized cupin superfamily protein